MKKYKKYEPSQIVESFLATLGYASKLLFKQIYGDVNPIKVNVKGSTGDINRFAEIIARDKRYQQAIDKYGLNNPKVLGDRFKLQNAIRGFEATTGIKYPFNL